MLFFPSYIMFESDVIFIGNQAVIGYITIKCQFESDVIFIGNQAYSGRIKPCMCLRVM